MTDRQATTPLDSKPRSPRPDRIDRKARLDAIWAQAYKAKTKDDLKELYAAWAASYDEDHATIGFFGHELTATVLGRHLTRHDASRVLDAGAGTGAAGEALHALGFRDLVAVDLSEKMLEKAQEKGIYAQTLVADLSTPVDSFADDSFDAAILVGVFSYGQAPAETLDEIIRMVRPGGAVAFTMRTDFYEENAMGVGERMDELEARGRWRLLECTDPRQYLPHKDPDAMFRVWCYRVTGHKTPEIEQGFDAAIRDALESRDWVKKIDHHWIWDSAASRLYDRYTHDDRYYLTDCEEEILQKYATEILGEQDLIVELGCGSARKINHILDARVRQGGSALYIPIDVSKGALAATEAAVADRFGDAVVVEPRQGLFDDVLHALPLDRRKLVFFFGSSIGNLDTIDDTVRFLESLRARLHKGDRLIVGMDLHKDPDVLMRAYGRGEACRSFFVHMLRRINEYLGADFDPRAFQLASTYEEEKTDAPFPSWLMNLRVAPVEPQRTLVRNLELEFELDAGQPVQVGVSRKLELDGIAGLGRLAGLALTRQWTDDRGWFSLSEFVNPG